MQQRIKMFSEILFKCIFLQDWLFAGSFQFWGVSVNHPLSVWRWRRRRRRWRSVHHTKRHCAWCWGGNNDILVFTDVFSEFFSLLNGFGNFEQHQKLVRTLLLHNGPYLSIFTAPLTMIENPEHLVYVWQYNILIHKDWTGSMLSEQ